MSNLFTVICEYKGGTYTTQLSASDPTQALALWAEQFSREEVLTPPERHLFAGEVQYALDEAGLVAVEGLHHVWYEGFSIGEDLFEVTVVGMYAG